MVRLWNLTSEERSLSTLAVLAQLIAGYRVGDGGTAADAETDLSAQWEYCRRKSPHEFALTSERIRRWHEDESRASESSGQWFAATFHLSRLVEFGANDPELRRRLAHAQQAFTNSVR